MVRCGDFLLTRLEDFGLCTLEDCNGGLLLFSTRTELIISDPMRHHLVPIQRARQRGFPDHGYAAHTFCLLPDLTTGGSKAACFRVISLQQRGQVVRAEAEAASFRIISLRQHWHVVRAEVFDSGTKSWSIHPVTGTALQLARSKGNQFFQAMHAAGRIYWKNRTEPILLALDTKAMRFHHLLAPPGVTSRSPYAVGETDDGACCLVHVAHAHGHPDGGYPRLQVWLHGVDDEEVQPWVLERDVPLRLRPTSVSRGKVRQVCAVAGGVVLLSFTSLSSHLPHVAFRLKNLEVEAEFTCNGLARPYLLDPMVFFRDHQFVYPEE
uniref:F-box protein AT5G49610-like beta-propeller domain-containing protein n=1 Tax=Oryza brachyantha TaxID=4533 RepID=J3LCT6_ORYBR